MPMITETSRRWLLAGGMGTRLRPLTDTIPKCLVPIAAGRPLLDVWIDRLAEAGIREARINTHALAEQVRPYIATSTPRAGSAWSNPMSRTLLGSAGTVVSERRPGRCADQIVIIYADNLSDIDLRPLLGVPSHP